MVNTGIYSLSAEIANPELLSTNVTLTPINIYSFNVNGMRQDSKRQSIFNKIKNDNGIILLQETHSTVRTEEI